MRNCSLARVLIGKSRRSELCELDCSYDVIGDLSKSCSDGRWIGHRVEYCWHRVWECTEVNICTEIIILGRWEIEASVWDLLNLMYIQLLKDDLKNKHSIMELGDVEAGGLSPLDDRLWETRVSNWNKLRVKEFISGREGKKPMDNWGCR